MAKGSECWFYALDNKRRDRKGRTTDPVFGEFRVALTQIAREDTRTVKGLNGNDTRYMEFNMPIKALELLDSLKHIHGQVCLMDDVHREAKLFALDGPYQVETLMKAFNNLGMVILECSCMRTTGYSRAAVACELDGLSNPRCQAPWQYN